MQYNLCLSDLYGVNCPQRIKIRHFGNDSANKIVLEI